MTTVSVTMFGVRVCLSVEIDVHVRCLAQASCMPVMFLSVLDFGSRRF